MEVIHIVQDKAIEMDPKRVNLRSIYFSVHFHNNINIILWLGFGWLMEAS